jgi:CBS domain-containing protein
MKARDVLQQEVVTVTPEASLKYAVHLMNARHVSGLPGVAREPLAQLIARGDLLIQCAMWASCPHVVVQTV